MFRAIVIITLLADVVYGGYAFRNSFHTPLKDTFLEPRIIAAGFFSVLLPLVMLYGIRARQTWAFIVFLVGKACFFLQILAQSLWVIGGEGFSAYAYHLSWYAWCFIVVLVYMSKSKRALQ